METLKSLYNTRGVTNNNCKNDINKRTGFTDCVCWCENISIYTAINTCSIDVVAVISVDTMPASVVTLVPIMSSLTRWRND